MMEETIQDFDALQLAIASPDEILGWSHGEVTKPETINYRTHRPERDGLFCERIFGPEKDYECACGKYKKIRYKGIICDRCGVEVTASAVRRERMGHIKLAVPVSHIWFLRGVPSKMSLFLDVSVKDLERVIYFTSYIIMSVDDDARKEALKNIDTEYKNKKKNLEKSSKLTAKEKAKELKKLEEKKSTARDELYKLVKGKVISEVEYYNLSHKYGEVFEAGIGAEALRRMMEEINLEEKKADLEVKLEKAVGVQRKKILKQLQLVKHFIEHKMRPEWMFWTIVPVIPPDLRPMVQLDGGRFATSDVNDLYRRVINRNNRLKRLIELKAPEVILRNEKRILQEAVDALIDNSARKGKEVRTASAQSRALKSLADLLKGKQGRFRQNLLGKRVDYSGRSVIIVGPDLKFDECGMPKKMALEIFKPFVIHKLIYEKELAPNIKAASRLIEEGTNEVWDALEEVIQNKYILLNRAPTLHRLSIQAFRPTLIEGNAIKLYPLVCQAFNADFDGDQMALHLPLTDTAQKEAEEIMRSSANLLKPATGHPIVNPTQDIVLGIYWMTKIEDGLKGEGMVFSSVEEAYLAYNFDKIDLKAKIKAPLPKESILGDDRYHKGDLIETNLGRLIFNEKLPDDFPFVNEVLNKKVLQKVVATLIDDYPDVAVETLDNIKQTGFHFSTLSGISWGYADLVTPPEKKKIIAEAEKKVEQFNQYYQQGLLTEEERKAKVIDTWFAAIDRIARLVPKALPPKGPIFQIFDSGSRGSWGQTTQMSGIKGLVINPASEIIELPVLSNFKEGFNVLEYFISTHGARKGTTDTALKTAVAGYLTRRLVDVCQDIIVQETDCHDEEGIIMYKSDGEDIGLGLDSRLVGRIILEDVKDSKGKIIARKGDLIDKIKAKQIADTGIEKIRIRSALTCKSHHGICQKCFGFDLGKNKIVELGAAIGIVTAQSIGEPGTQLTMRTFHAGGVAGEGDITQGLPRVEEILELRTPHEKALVSEVDGKVIEIKKEGQIKEIVIKPSKEIVPLEKKKQRKSTKAKIKKNRYIIYSLPMNRRTLVSKGDLVTKGQQLSDGHLDLKTLYRLKGKEEVQRYIIREVQNIYFFQGAAIDERYIEVVVRKMFSRVRIIDEGKTDFLIGQIVEKNIFEEVNSKLKKADQAKGVELLMGITKVSLSTESFLSAASFQETERVLINAACEGKIDRLKGLKENVIIGKLIPAGTGYRKRKIKKA